MYVSRRKGRGFGQVPAVTSVVDTSPAPNAATPAIQALFNMPSSFVCQIAPSTCSTLQSGMGLNSVYLDLAVWGLAAMFLFGGGR
jgi:hypothetical protein